jgi:hypothetical protein
LLSDPKFYEWARDYVLYCHVTTRLKDRPYEGLLKEKGGTGFPTLAILAADGELLARHEGPRTVAGVSATAENAKKIAALRARAGGDAKAAFDLLEAEADAGMVSPGDMIQRAKAIGARAPELKPRLDDFAFAGEVEELSQQTKKSPETLKAACDRVLGWASENRIPERPRAYDAFWGIVGDRARATKDVKLMQRAVDALKKGAGADSNRLGRVGFLESQLDTFKKMALIEELRPKAESGDQDAKRQVLLAMAQLRTIPHAEAVTKLAELTSLNESQRKELDDELFRLDVSQTSAASRTPDGWEPAFAKVRGWVEAKKFPAGSANSIWMIPLQHSMLTGDPEGLDFVMKNASEADRGDKLLSQLIDIARKSVDKKKSDAAAEKPKSKP